MAFSDYGRELLKRGILEAKAGNKNAALRYLDRALYMSHDHDVTLLTDKDAAIPVLNARTQQRSAAFGGLTGEFEGMELRFLAGNADVQPGDLLTTSGVDGVYPPGLPVAKVVKVDRKVDSGFARVALQPLAQADGVRHVLVLEPIGSQMPARPAPEPETPRAGRSKATRR